MARKDPRQATGLAASIGFIVRRGGRLEVHCCACGAGLATPPGIPKRAGEKKLREIGWSDAIDGLWRCPKHKPQQETADGQH